MIKNLNRLISIIDQVNEWIGKQISWLTTVLVVLICTDVVMRYFFDFSSAGVFEMEWHLFAIIFLFGAGYTLRHDKHVRVDVFYSRFNEKQKAWINLTGTILLLMPFCVVIIVTSIRFVENSFLISESSPDPGGLPKRYFIKSAITIGFTLLFLQSFSMAAKALIVIIDPNQPVKS